MHYNASRNEKGYLMTEIYYTMDRMGPAATEADAVEMLGILNANGLSAANISDLSEDCWLTLCGHVASVNA